MLGKKKSVFQAFKRFNIGPPGPFSRVAVDFQFERVEPRRSLMPRLRSLYLFLFALCTIPAYRSFAADTPDELPARTYLHKNWQIQSSCEVKATGEQISSAGFDTKGWHQADVPATVMGA